VLPDLFIVPDTDNARIEVRFTAPKGCSEFTWEVADGPRAVAAGRGDATPGAPVRFEVGMAGFRPWNVDTPHLYALNLALAGGGKATSVSETFGMRTIRAAPDGIYVNGQPFYVRGYIRGREAHDHPNLDNLPAEEYYARNIRAAKAYGFNLARFHSKVPPEECFAAADRLGIFLHVEYRTYFGLYQDERDRLDDAGELIDLDGWRAMILALRNHPSLMVYCIGNEIHHPGTNPRVAQIAAVTKQLDPTRLFIDTCAHGEFDRDHVDIDVQHMSYHYPFGRNYGMFEDTQNWLIFGSCTGLPMASPPGAEPAAARVTRSIQPPRPVLAHEVCHYVALRDLEALERKFARAGAEKPWWIDELNELVAQKHLAGDYPRMLAASKRFQMINWKLGIEAARRSGVLAGLHFLQLADTDRYENSNGVVDCFDEPAGVDEQAFGRFNGDTVLLADLPRRTFFEGERVRVPIVLSHFSPSLAGQADLQFRLSGPDVDLAGGLTGQGLRAVENDWTLWAYPDRPQELAFPPCTAVLDEIDLARRYPQFRQAGSAEEPAGLLIANRFTEAVFEHLAGGGDVLMLYRVPETRDRKVRAAAERYYLPATWDRFKGVIWDRGTNLGAFVRPSEALAGFPNDGLLDLQFHGLIDDCDKIVLDDFPCPVEPILQGVDKASRDRFDVHTFKLSELQPAWTMRKFAYLFELRAGAGRLLVSGMNFTGLGASVPEACAMFESLLRYAASEAFQPRADLPIEELKAYLLAKGRAPRVRERMMTQYWQLDDAPLESAQYWKDAEAYIRHR